MAEARKSTPKKPAKTKQDEENEGIAVRAKTLDEAGANESDVVAGEKAEATSATERTAAPAAKAGKRSAKSLAAEDAKLAKEARKTKTSESETGTAAKPAQKPARSRLERRGKKYRAAADAIDFSKEYTIAEAVGVTIKSSPVKFDATAELHINLAVDPRHADQNVRGNLVLPHGTGRTIRVAVLAEDDESAKAKKAGADLVGADELFAALDKSQFEFDVLIATPGMMGRLGKYARLLGPKGLMPNPKSGTVTPHASKAVSEAKAGRIEYRVDSAGIIHCGFGKVSFGPDKLSANARAVLQSVKAAKPASIKGGYVKSVYMTTTMGPAVRVAVSELSN